MTLYEHAQAFFGELNESSRAHELLQISDMRIVCSVTDGSSFYADVHDGKITKVIEGDPDVDNTDPEVVVIEGSEAVWMDIFTADTTPAIAFFKNRLHIPGKMGKQNLVAAVTASMRSVQGPDVSR